MWTLRFLQGCFHPLLLMAGRGQTRGKAHPCVFLPSKPNAGNCWGREAGLGGFRSALVQLFLCSPCAFLDPIQLSTHQESPDFFSAFLSPLLLCPACCFPSTCCYLEIRMIFLHFG